MRFTFSLLAIFVTVAMTGCQKEPKSLSKILSNSILSETPITGQVSVSSVIPDAEYICVIWAPRHNSERLIANSTICKPQYGYDGHAESLMNYSRIFVIGDGRTLATGVISGRVALGDPIDGINNDYCAKDAILHFEGARSFQPTNELSGAYWFDGDQVSITKVCGNKN